jgi:hypothetical protein
MRRWKDNIKADLKDVTLFTMLMFNDTWILVNPACRVLRLQMEERLPDMENRYDYIDKVFADSQEMVVIQLGSWARC